VKSCQAAGSIGNPTLNTNSAGFKRIAADVYMDFLVYKKPRNHSSKESAIDGFASDEAAAADCSSANQSWADVGVDLSGRDDPFHADWAFWK
jgi:hypothetical protein